MQKQSDVQVSAFFLDESNFMICSSLTVLVFLAHREKDTHEQPLKINYNSSFYGRNKVKMEKVLD